MVSLRCGSLRAEPANEIVHQYYYQNTELSAEEKVQGLLHNAPKYMFFNDREKEIFYKSIYKKVRGV